MVDCAEPVSAALGDDLVDVLDEITLSVPGASEAQRLVRVSTSRAKPVAYRISLVSQEPTESILGRDTARDAAEQYLFSIAVGDSLELSWATGTRLTTAEMTALREKLFKTSREFTSDADLIFHPEEVTDSVARLPSQRIVISEGEDASGRRWAFVVECIQKTGGRWFVKRASVDTPASNDRVDAVIQKDADDQAQASRMEALGGIGTYAALAGLLWLLPLAMTLVCELPVAALFGVGRRGLAAVALINVVTNPALNLLLLGMYAVVPFALVAEDASGMSYSVPWWTYVTVLLLEIVVVWVEWRMLVWALHETVGGSRKLLVLAVSMNAVSALLGSALLFGWPLLLLRGS